MKRLLAFVCSTVVLFCTEMSYAMPSQAELDNVQPLVNELMGPLVKDFKAKKKLAVEVGDGAVELVAEANSEAAKFVLLKGAVSYYARAKAYDKAADTIESIMELVPDIPPKTLYEITSKAAASATVKNAPRLVALNKSAQKRAAVATRLASVKAQLRKTPADLKLIRQHAELLAAMGKWETAFAEFAKLGGEIGKMATADADAMGEGTELADFWWNYTPTASEAKDAIRSHAASLYQKALDHVELDGLKRTLAERRIAEVAESNPQAVASKVEYKFNYILDNNGNATICRTCNNPSSNRGDVCVSPKPIGVLIIPEYIDGHRVVSIGRDAFYGCDKITKMVLPKSIERFDYGTTFCTGCYALKEIVVSPANPHYSSFDGALFTKDRKSLLAHPKARNEIRLPPETKVIEPWAFIAYNLKTLKIPKGITHVGGFSISYCPNLEVVEFPDSLSRIEGRIFCGTPNIKKVVFNGDAPSYDSRLLEYTAAEPIIEVKRGSKGWKSPGSTELPERWPLNGKSSPIRYITK